MLCHNLTDFDGTEQQKQGYKHIPLVALVVQNDSSVVFIKSPRNVKLQAVICALITVSG